MAQGADVALDREDPVGSISWNSTQVRSSSSALVQVARNSAPFSRESAQAGFRRPGALEYHPRALQLSDPVAKASAARAPASTPTAIAG
jgi:hypothetical protein